MYIIKNGLIIDPQSGFNQVSDMLIDQGKIKQISKEIDIKGIPIIDASNKIVAPGLVDIHVHFREPGQTHKENIHTGALSAAAGGFTTVLMMANTNPTISSPEIVKQVKESAAKEAIKIETVATITKSLNGKDLVNFEELLEAGAAGFSDDGIPLTDTKVLQEAMNLARKHDVVLSLHEEDPSLNGVLGINEHIAQKIYHVCGASGLAEYSMIARDAMIAYQTQAKVHIQHLSSSESVEVVDFAQKLGANLTAEVTPQHFSKTEDLLLTKGANAKLNPPLRLEKDRQALSRYNVATAKLYRQVSGETMPQILIVIDSYEGLREAQTLTNLEACFQNISRDGSSLGISLVISAGRMAALRSSLMANLKERIALKLTDDSESRTLVGRHQHIMEDIPGRGLIKRDDIEVLQVALPTEGTETFDIISNIQTESDAMNDKWTGPRPKAIPIVPEELTFDDFMATDSVQADLSANRLPLGLEMVDVESFSLPLTKFKHLLFLSDSDEGLENLGSHLLKTLIKVPEYSTMIIDSLGEHEAYQGQVRTYVGADMISDMAEQLNYELGKRQEQNAFDRWFILIPDFESFVSKTNLSLEQIQNLLDNGPKVGLHLIIGSAFSFVGSKLDPVNKYVKTNSQYVMLGMRLMDQTFLEKVYNSKEARLERDEAYIHDRKNYQKLKLSID